MVGQGQRLDTPKGSQCSPLIMGEIGGRKQRIMHGKTKREAECDRNSARELERVGERERVIESDFCDVVK